MSIEKRMANLERISWCDGIPYGRAHRIFDAESQYGNEAARYVGYLVTSDAFKCFFLETIELVNTEIRPKITEPLPAEYAQFIPRMTHGFQALCAAERVALNGYPYQGYTLLRNSYDNFLLTSAALQGITDFHSIEGIKPGTRLDLAAVKKLRKDTEFSVRKSMVGEKSGLSSSTVAQLKVWDDMFDYETHGARLSMTHSMGWMRGKGDLPVLPSFDEMAFAMFMNRYLEIAWMFHRQIPAIQPAGIPFIDPWHEKWEIIDDSFQAHVGSLTMELGKKIGGAMVEFVLAKFPFNSKAHFSL